ncbi:hypothetical protein [Streptomyces sp. NBC_00459]|uniref:hypothetical protein n=1 Tax=Streptomyces sp. NBC_00459 TaxID=2975749 RepID=UPI002E18480E
MNPTPCPSHKAGGNNIWENRCGRCGVRLLDRTTSPEQLVGRISSALQIQVEATGRIRGVWAEVLEEVDGELWAWWARPANNLLGYEGVSVDSPEPSAEELRRALMVELLRVPVRPSAPVRPPQASRWSRFKKWSRRSAEREFVTLAMPITCIWAVALGWVLGVEGMAAFSGLLVGWLF